jgi:hypothetical protein
VSVRDADIDELLGQTLSAIEVDRVLDEVKFTLTDGRIYKLWHYQDCCESVFIEDVCGDVDDLVGSPLTMAEEATNIDEDPEGVTVDPDEAKYRESFTWTFYKFATVKGYVTIRWYGTSNGYYSESVELVELTK